MGGIVIIGGGGGGGGGAGSVLVAHQESSFTAISNTTSESTVASLVLPAGTVSAGDVVEFECVGELLNNSAGSINHTFRFALGSTTVFATPAIGMSNAATSRIVTCRVRVQFASASSQRVQGHITTTGTASTGWVQLISSGGWLGYGTASEASSSNLTFALTSQAASASASNSIQVHGATLTRLAA